MSGCLGADTNSQTDVTLYRFAPWLREPNFIEISAEFLKFQEDTAKKSLLFTDLQIRERTKRVFGTNLRLSVFFRLKYEYLVLRWIHGQKRMQVLY
jgi:hypothetical protein